MRHVLVTGSPGVGKTTLTGKVAEALRERGVGVTGFLTRDVRQAGKRIGFDVETLTGARSVLSRVGEAADFATRVRVGQYLVNLPSFETCALPQLTAASPADVLLIDEVGRMELFSRAFIDAVRDAFRGHRAILATLPNPARAADLPLVNELFALPHCHVFEVTFDNRNHLQQRIVDIFLAQ